MDDEYITFTDPKLLPIDYQILNLRMSFNKDLYENKIISLEIYNKMQQFLIKKMNKIVLDNNV